MTLQFVSYEDNTRKELLKLTLLNVIKFEVEAKTQFLTVFFMDGNSKQYVFIPKLKYSLEWF